MNDNELIKDETSKVKKMIDDNAKQKLFNTMTSDWSELSKKGNLNHRRKGLKVLISILILILIVVAAAFVYLKFFKLDSEKMYNYLFKEYSSKIIKEIKKDTDKMIGSHTENGNITINTDMQEYKMLNGSSLDYSLELDTNSSIMNTKLTYKEKDKNIVEADIYVQDGKLYLKSNQIYNKLLYIPDTDEISLKNNISKEDIENTQYLVEQSSLYLQKALTKAKYKTENGSLIIRGKKVRIQKNIMIIDKSNINTIKNEMVNSIKNDSRFLSIIKNIYKIEDSKISTYLEELINKDISSETEKVIVEIDTKFITNKILGFKVLENNETIVNTISTGNKTYAITIEKDFKGEITINNSNNISLETKYKGYNIFIEIVTTDNKDAYQIVLRLTDKNGKHLNVSIKNNTIDKEVKKVSVENAVDTSKLSENTEEIIESNLTKLIYSSELLKTFAQN